jgi:hypothetical protein
MNTMKSIKRSIIGLSIVLAFILAMPMTVFATEPPSNENNLTLEYRFAEGESPDVAPVVSQFGINYRLVGQSDPVREDSLANTRDYTYRINGLLSPDDLATIQNIQGLSLTPVNQKMTRKIDSTAILTGLTNNDVDSLLESTQYAAAVEAMKTAGAVYVEGPKLTGVTFEVTLWEGGVVNGLPAEYSADIIVRGVEEYTIIGYYIANMTYTTSVLDSETPIYVIVAEYEPIDLPIVEDTIVEEIEEEGDGEIVEPIDQTFFDGLTEDDLIMMDNQTGNPFTDIASGNVPLGGGSVRGGVSLLSAILSIVAVAFLIINIIALAVYRKRKDDLSEYGVDEEQAMAGRRRKNAFVALICIVSVLVPVIWIALDNLTFPFVWLNAWTAVVAVCFVIDVVLIIIYNAKFKKVEKEEEAFV